MKTKIKRHYRSVVSVLLSVCMLVSCMTVGLIATDAARVTEDEAVSATVKDDASVGAYRLDFINAYLYKSDGTEVSHWYSITENTTYDFTISTQGSYKFKFEAGYYPSNYGGGAEQYRSCWANLDVSDGYVTDSTNKWAQSWSSETSYTFKAKKYNFLWHGANEVDNGEKFQVQYDLVFAPENNPTKITAPTDCTATVSNGTTTITSTGLASSGSLTQNSTATVTITPPTGKKVTTATLTGSTSQTLNLTSTHDGTYSATYTVPSNTTETAITFSDPVDKSSYKVNVVSSDVSEGTVAATVGGVAYDPTASYLEDTAVTLTATPESGFVFVNWDFKTTADSSDNSATYYVDGADATGDTVTITGSFDVPGYAVKIDNGIWANMKLLKNGYYISTATVANTKTFVMKRTVDDYLADSNAADYWINPGGSDTVTWVESTNNVFSNHQGGARYIVFNPTTNKVWLSEDAEAHTSTQVLVKKGAVFGSSSSCDNASSFSASATVAGANWTGSFSSQWDGRVKQGDFTATEVGKGVKVTVSVTTTGDTIKVAGFVVNGESVLSDDITVSGNTYTMTYTVPEYPPEKIEITPVYKQTSGTIRFYVVGVDGDIREKWGDTIYCYAYYGSKDGATYGTNGSYPGQPLLYENGRYFLDLPEKDAADATKALVGITLNNGAWDDVHAYRYIGASRSDEQKNAWQCQSYDYDDMIKINALENNKVAANPSYVKADIIFELKSKGVKAATASNLSNTYSADGTGYPNTINPSDFTFEYLTDYYGKHVDVFGNEIDKSSAYYNDTTYLLISQGYDQNSVGHFATSWIVYKNVNGTYTRDTTIGTNGYVGTTSESQFLDSGLENQSGWSALKDKGVQVSFEYAVNQKKSNNNTSDGGKDQPATRYDGRWYVSKVLDVKAHVLIEYGRSEHSTFTRDYFQEGDIDYKSASGYDPSKVEGLVTKTKAHFSETPYSTESKKSTAKNADGSSVNKFNFVAEDDTEGKYTFIGWYKYNDKNEAERVSTKKNYSVDVKNSEELIARFIKTPAGSVIISHDLLTGSEGLGTTLNSVSIVESDKSRLVAAVDPNPITSSSTGAAKIDSKAITVENAFDVSNSNADRGRLVKIVLNTTPNGATFQHFHYDIDKSGSPAQLTASASGSPFVIDEINEENATATIYIPLSYFFKEENGDKIFDEAKDTLKFYSELEVTKRTVTIKKVLPDFVSDSSTGFSVHIEVSDTESGTYSNITGTFTSSIPANSGSFTDGKVAIHNGETITFAVDKNKYFKVTEENIPSPYEFDALYFTNDTSNNLGNGYKCLADSDKSFEVRNKVFANYTINYTYPSRFNNLTGVKLYGDQTYTVNGKIDSTDADFSTYIDYTNSKVKEALVIAKNPFESDFMYNFVWDFNKTDYNPNGAAYTANVTTTTPTTQNVHVTFEFPYDYMNATGTGWTGTSNIYSATSDDPAKTAYQSPAAISIGYQTVPYALEPYCDENNVEQTGYRIHCTTAPKKCGGNDFLYWSIREQSIGSDEWVEVARCYTNEYTYATFNNYHVRPIFAGDPEADTTTEEDKSEATIKFLDTSRNQWNNNQKGTKSTSYAGQDMVYADFDVAYRYKGQDVDDSTDLKVGVLIENIGTIEPGYLLDHRNTTTTEEKTAYTNSLAHYKDKTYYAYDAEAIKTYLRSVIHNDTPAADAQTAYQSTLGRAYTLNLKQRQPDQTLTNMNRVEYYHGSTVRFIANNADDKVNEWTVNNANTSGVFRAYSYIVDADGNVTLSEPTYYTLYGTATLDHLTTE